MVPVLETARTRLRGHRLEDFEASAALWADLQVVQYISGQASSREASWSRLLRHIGHWRALGFGYWLVEDRESGGFLGEVGIADYRRELVPPLDYPEAGWVLARHAQSRGLATEAMGAVLAWADAGLPARATSCILDPEHAVSKRVAEKLGYRELHLASYRGAPSLVMQRPRGG